MDLVARSNSFPPMGHCEHRQKHHERVAFETAQKKAAPGAQGPSLVLEPIDLVIQCLFSRPGCSQKLPIVPLERSISMDSSVQYLSSFFDPHNQYPIAHKLQTEEQVRTVFTLFFVRHCFT